MSRRSIARRRGALPAAVGARDPKTAWGAWPVLALLALATPACTSSSADQVTKPVALGMGSMLMPFSNDGQTMLFQVQVPVPLPVRAMTAADTQAAGAAPAGTPYPSGVFLHAEDEQVEVHFTLSNLDTSDHSVWLLIDPWNEFVQWKPGVTVTEEAVVPNFGYDLFYSVPAQQRLVGTITSDDMHEIAIKLASAEQLLASPQAQAQIQAQASGQMQPAGTMFDATSIANNIFNPQNRSNSTPPDLLYTPWIPPVIAGVTGFDLGLRTSDSAPCPNQGPGMMQSCAPNLAVEITMEIVDLQGNRFVQQDSNAAQMGPPPVTLSPPNAN